MFKGRNAFEAALHKEKLKADQREKCTTFLFLRVYFDVWHEDGITKNWPG